MHKNLIYDANYYYFIHGTTFEKLRDSREGLFDSQFEPISRESAIILMNEIFKNGLVSRNESLSYTTMQLLDYREDQYPALMHASYREQIDLEKHNPYCYIENCLKLYQIDKHTKGYNFLIKIPKEYLDTQDLDKAFPIWRGTSQKDWLSKRICYLDPHFIVGMYDTVNNQFIANLMYNPVFDPSGLLLNSQMLYYSTEEPTTDYLEMVELRRKLFDGGKLLDYDRRFNNFESRIQAIMGENQQDTGKNKIKSIIKKINRRKKYSEYV